MPNFSRRAERRLQGLLEPDEQFVFAGVAQPGGSRSRANMHRREDGRLPDDWSELVARDDDQIAGRVPTRNGYLSVTSQRLIWLEQRWTGFPTTEIVTTFDHAEVLGASSHHAGRTGTHAVIVNFADGSKMDVWVHKSNDHERLVDAINTLARVR
jgi:hypothetical protein